MRFFIYRLLYFTLRVLLVSNMAESNFYATTRQYIDMRVELANLEAQCLMLRDKIYKTEPIVVEHMQQTNADYVQIGDDKMVKMFPAEFDRTQCPFGLEVLTKKFTPL